MRAHHNALLLVVCTAVWLVGTNAAGKTVMPWLCLERCSDNIQADIAALQAHHSDLTAVSCEYFDVSPTGGIIVDGFTDLTSDLHSLKLQALPMVTTVDIYKLELLFANPQPFISSATKYALANGWAGFNLDFEPCQYVRNCTNEHAIHYVQFLNKFADALHAIDLRLTVDVATWSPFWNFTLLAESRVDTVIMMTTYTYNFQDFEAALKLGVNTFGVDKLGVGLCDSCGGPSPPAADMQERFNLLKAYNIQQIDLWDWVVPDFWWPMIHDFLQD